MDEQSNNVSDLADPAQRAGSIVAEHINSVIDAAERQAHEVLSDAERDAEATRRDALESAQRVFERIDQLERPLREFVQNLRLETDRVERELAGHVDAEATTIPSESESAKAALSEGGEAPAASASVPTADGVKAVEEPVETVGEPVEKPVGERAEESGENLVEKPIEERVGKRKEKRIEERVGKRKAKPVEERVGKSEGKPVDEREGKLGEKRSPEKKAAGQRLGAKKPVADKPGGKRPATKKPAGTRSSGSKPVDQTVEGPARQAAESPLATASKPGWKRWGRNEPAPKPEAEHSVEAERVTRNGDERAAEHPATDSTSPVVGTASAEAKDPRTTAVSPTVESGPAKLASRLLGRLRDASATNSAFITTEGHCSVCPKTFMAGSEEDLEQSGWKVSGDVGLCPECQSDAWQLPEGARLPFRRGGG